jgi:hypothetical protein
VRAGTTDIQCREELVDGAPGGPDGKDGGINFAARGNVGRIVFEIDGAGGAVILDGGMDAFGRRGVTLVVGLEFGCPATGAGRIAFGVVVFGAGSGRS